MLQRFPQIGSNRLSGDEDAWRILIRWKQEGPTTVYTIQEALSEAEKLQQRNEHELAQKIRQAADHAPLH
jgi:hypothetical protein